MFFTLCKTKFNFQVPFVICKCLMLDESKMVPGCKITLSLHRHSFWRINNRQLFENIVGKGEIAPNEQFLLFPQCFKLSQIIVSPFVYIFDIISLFAAEFEEPKIGIKGKELILSQTGPGFYPSALQVLWKHCGNMRNCSKWAISPFSSVFYRFWELFAIFMQLELSSTNSIRLEECKICRLGKG